MEEVDLVIVGAGLYGITCASTYHRLHPNTRILLLESGPSIGGPWAPHRIFPGLKTNNLWGTLENPDLPMHQERFGVKEGEHLPAKKVTEYLQALIEENGIGDFIRLNTKVEVIEKTVSGWRLCCRRKASESDTGSYDISTPKLILSIGLHNQPVMPQYPTSPTFSSPIVHSAQFASHFDKIVKPASHTLVVGGGKSAWDIAYACATQPDSTATMLLRPSGNGPVWMSPSHVTPLGLWLEKVVFTRFFGYLSPCPWAETTGFEGWVRGFLHHTWLGRKIVGAIWGIMSKDVVSLNKLDDHPETKKLRPWRDSFESGNALSILNYPTSFFDLVKEGRIKIVVDDIERLGDGKQVFLRTGGTLNADAVVCATGWKAGTSLTFKPKPLSKDLGLPSTELPGNDEISLIKEKESELYAHFPYLQTRDSTRRHHPVPELRGTQNSQNDAESQQPFRLYRFIVPPSDLPRRSIGFAGAVACLGTASCAYLQALWITAYLDGTLPVPSVSTPAEVDQVRDNVYRDTQYCVMRNAMGFGNQYPDLVFDSLPYFDVLMRDLGFEGKRKGGWGPIKWRRESFWSYGPEDYRGLVDAWEHKTAVGQEDKKHI